MPRIMENRIGRIAVIAAALLLPVAGAWSLDFDDATADRVYGAQNLTTAGASIPNPDGLAFDASGNLWVADRLGAEIHLFLAPGDTTGAGSASFVLRAQAIDSGNPAAANGLIIGSIRKLVVTTTETDVLWATFTGDTGNPAAGAETGGVVGFYIPASLDASTVVTETSAGRGNNNDTLSDIIIGWYSNRGDSATPANAIGADATNSSAGDSGLENPGGITARETTDTITLFVADAYRTDTGTNRVLGFHLNAPQLQNMVFGTAGNSQSNDSRADILIGQDVFNERAGGSGDSSLRAAVDVAWCANRLLIADSSNFRVVATDVDSNIADSFVHPTAFAFGDSDGDFGSVVSGSYTGDTGFLHIQQIFCDGVSLAVSDSDAPANLTSGRVLVFTLDSDTQADDAIGGTLDVANRTFTANAAGVSATTNRGLLDISGASGLIVVSDVGNFRVLGFSGTVGSGAAAAVSGDGGTCLIEAAFTGASLEAALPWIRGARDSMLGSTVGRFLTSAYYSVLGLAAVALLGAGLAVAARRN